MNNFVEMIRGLTRPVVTLTLVGILSATVVRILWTAKMPALPPEVWIGLLSSFTTTVAAVIAFWFGSRNAKPPDTPGATPPGPPLPPSPGLRP